MNKNYIFRSYLNRYFLTLLSQPYYQCSIFQINNFEFSVIISEILNNVKFWQKLQFQPSGIVCVRVVLITRCQKFCATKQMMLTIQKKMQQARKNAGLGTSFPSLKENLDRLGPVLGTVVSFIGFFSILCSFLYSGIYFSKFSCFSFFFLLRHSYSKKHPNENESNLSVGTGLFHWPALLTFYTAQHQKVSSIEWLRWLIFQLVH